MSIVDFLSNEMLLLQQKLTQQKPEQSENLNEFPIENTRITLKTMKRTIQSKQIIGLHSLRNDDETNNLLSLSGGLVQRSQEPS